MTDCVFCRTGLVVMRQGPPTFSAGALGTERSSLADGVLYLWALWFAYSPSGQSFLPPALKTPGVSPCSRCSCFFHLCLASFRNCRVSSASSWREMSHRSQPQSFMDPFIVQSSVVAVIHTTITQCTLTAMFLPRIFSCANIGERLGTKLLCIVHVYVYYPPNVACIT